ncbi:unnamed protein product [Lactuca virosa]|uniref:Uncharacterized protein n=1 Tax=Lactuca virosa TaxID=75947 RepID=A0AAU9P9M2_9ASTR|nr:unnamed protein product [Lactuca virosa]
MDLSYGTTCILTHSLTRINEAVTCKFNNNLYNVGVIEYDYNWHPFYHIPATQEHLDDEDEDANNNDLSKTDSVAKSDEEGISKTWVNNHEEDLEEG